MVRMNLFVGQEQRYRHSGQGGGGMNWEVSFSISTPPCVKQRVGIWCRVKRAQLSAGDNLGVGVGVGWEGDTGGRGYMYTEN